MAGKRKTEDGGTAVMDVAARDSITDAVLLAARAQAALTASEERQSAVETVEPSQAEGKAEFVLLPLEAIAESPWNPRKHFDPKELADLTTSVALDGVWEPVLVRPHASGHGVYELASGHRRYRASKAAGRTHIPALVRELSDETFLKLLTIANLQREDVHPLEQADAFATQMKEFGWKPDRIARECGRGETFVYDHLKFLTLIEPVRELFFANRISTAHAVELTRLTPAQQELAIDPIDGGLWEGAALSRAEEHELELDEAAQEADPYAGMKTRTFRELRGWIQDYLRFDVAAADPVLFPSATMVKTAVAEKIKVFSITWDRYPRDEAKKAEGDKILTPLHWRRADGREGSALCEYAAKSVGVVVVGPGQGESFAICRAREKCTTHFGDEIKAKAKAAKARVAVAPRSSTVKAPAAPKEQSWVRQQRLQRERDARMGPLVPALTTLLQTKVKSASVTALVDHILQDEGEVRFDEKVLKQSPFPRGRTADDFLRCMLWQGIVDVLEREWDRARRLGELCKAWGIDLKRLEKEHAPKQEKPAAAKAVKPAVKKPAKKSGATR